MLIALALTACDGAATATATTPAVTAPAANASAPSDISPEHVVAAWKGGQLTYGDILPEIQASLQKAEVDYLKSRYQTQTQAGEGGAIKALIEAEAAAKGVSDENLVKAEVEDKVSAATDAEIEEYYQVVRRQLRGQPLDAVRPQVEGALLQKKQAERFQAWIEELKATYELTLDIPYPDLPRIDVSLDDDPSKGPDEAKVTIVEFGDYECPYCKKGQDTLEAVLAAYGDDIHFVYRDFPLSFHQNAIPAAVAANCAGEQDKYWEMHDLLMANQRSFSAEAYEGWAAELGLDAAAFDACSAKPEHVEEVQKDFIDGQRLGVTGTPAFFVNGVFLNGAVPYDEFKGIIEAELEG